MSIITVPTAITALQVLDHSSTSILNCVNAQMAKSTAIAIKKNRRQKEIFSDIV
jgi:hypothetical protein